MWIVRKKSTDRCSDMRIADRHVRHAQEITIDIENRKNNDS